MSNQRVNQRCRAGLVQMFAHFQTQDDIETPAQTPRHSKVLLAEETFWNQEFILCYLGAIHAKHILDPEIQGCFQPSSGPAAHIQQAPRLGLRKDERECRLRPFQRVFILRVLVVNAHFLAAI